MASSSENLQDYCECDCGDVEGDESNWSCCECTLCGIGQCSVRCSEVVRFWVATERGHDRKGLHDRMAAPGGLSDEDKVVYPKFCGDCREHQLLIIRRKAVVKSRDRRREVVEGTDMSRHEVRHRDTYRGT